MNGSNRAQTAFDRGDYASAFQEWLDAADRLDFPATLRGRRRAECATNVRQKRTDRLGHSVEPEPNDQHITRGAYRFGRAVSGPETILTVLLFPETIGLLAPEVAVSPAP